MYKILFCVMVLAAASCLKQEVPPIPEDKLRALDMDVISVKFLPDDKGLVRLANIANHWHQGDSLECRYEGLECPILSGSQDSVWYHNGEILLPDYIHPDDTLIVTDAAFLNEQLILNKYDVETDGDISDILAAGCLTLTDYINKQSKIKQNEKSTINMYPGRTTDVLPKGTNGTNR